ncbi:unnamed protein product [Candida verbasci]|uniref:Uncharacterized protein n=1 Tax=Candida verbasci TaxID=1227364 RepID=A0A9W4TZR3_9ASCO|nr:unnamed protein product [Candida verbasci]
MAQQQIQHQIELLERFKSHILQSSSKSKQILNEFKSITTNDSSVTALIVFELLNEANLKQSLTMIEMLGAKEGIVINNPLVDDVMEVLEMEIPSIMESMATVGIMRQIVERSGGSITEDTSISINAVREVDGNDENVNEEKSESKPKESKIKSNRVTKQDKKNAKRHLKKED